MFDPDSLSQSKLNSLRAAAEQAWGDDTRHERFIGHPASCMGQCFVTSQWMAKRLGGHVGQKDGHFFWVSPDKRYAVDLTGDRTASPPVHPDHQTAHTEEGDFEVDPEHKTWRAGPVIYKSTENPLFRGFRVIGDRSDHPRAKQFARRADLALAGKRVSSVHVADLMGPSGFQTPQQEEDNDLQSLPFPMLHDEPNYDPATHPVHEYKWVFANGQLHVSPIHEHAELFQHAGANPASDGPAAVGYVKVDQGHALWEVESNISLRGLHNVLSDYSDTVGWDFDGMVGTNGEPLHESFGAKKSLWYAYRKDGHLLMSERPLPKARRLRTQGATAYVADPEDEALKEWANDAGYKLAEYPGGGDMTDKMKTKENLDQFNRGDTDFQPERNNPDLDLTGPLTCGQCGAEFRDLDQLRVHERYDHRPKDYQEIEDGHFPQIEDFDAPLPLRRRQPLPNWGETIAKRTAVMVLPDHRMAARHPRFDLYAGLFGYDHDDGHQFYGAYRDGQLVGYGAIRLNSEFEDDLINGAALPHGLAKNEDLSDQLDSMYGEPEIGNYWFRHQMLPISSIDTGGAPMRLRDYERLGEDVDGPRRAQIVRDHMARLQAGESPIPLVVDPVASYVKPHQRMGDYWLRDGYHRLAAARELGYTEHPAYVMELDAQGNPIERTSKVAEPEVLMIDAVQSGSGVGTAILSLMQRHFDSFYTHADSDAGERLMSRLGMVNVEGRKWRWSKGQEPKDMIEAAIPFVYDFQQNHVEIGYPGQRTHDITPRNLERFTPGGIVEGYYEPGGKVILIPASNLPYSNRQFAQAWYHRFPQMEITKLEEELPDGKTHKIAAEEVGNYVRRILPTDQAAYRAYHALRDAGGKVYAVGGVVRDALQGREPNDIDLMVGGMPSEQVEQILSKVGRVDLTGKRFGVYRLHIGHHEVEVALPRQDKYETSRRGEGVITVDHNLPIEKDLERRDFTANSMAVDLDNGQLIDPYGGAHDSQNHILRTTHPDSFREDPSRLVRALGMHGRFGLNPDEKTRHEMEAHGHLLRSESPDAINQILTKSVFGPKNGNPAGSVRLGQQTGLLTHLFPELAQNWHYDQNNPHHNYTLGEHTLHVLDNVSRLSSDPDVRMAALYHDVGKPASATVNPQTGFNRYYEVIDPVTKEVSGADHALVGAHMAESRMRALNYPVARINRVRNLVEHHMFGAFNSPKGARKFLQRVGDHADDLLNLRQADMAGKGVTPEEQAAQQSVTKMRELVDQARQQQAPTDLSNLQVNGNDLIGLGLKPGPQVGQILRQLLNDVVEQPTLNERNALLQRAQQYIAAQPA